jgi:single-strand DNA-binding protein
MREKDIMGESITVVGNIAGEIKHLTSSNGTPITSFRLASTERRYDAEKKEWVDAETNFYSVSAFRALARNAYASFQKGERIVVTGKLRIRAWDNIDAESLGHDLRWGTTAFTKVTSTSTETGPTSSAPGNSSAEQTEPRDDESRELVAAGRSGGAGIAGEQWATDTTPF